MRQSRCSAPLGHDRRQVRSTTYCPRMSNPVMLHPFHCRWFALEWSYDWERRRGYCLGGLILRYGQFSKLTDDPIQLVICCLWTFSFQVIAMSQYLYAAELPSALLRSKSFWHLRMFDTLI